MSATGVHKTNGTDKALGKAHLCGFFDGRGEDTVIGGGDTLGKVVVAGPLQGVVGQDDLAGSNGNDVLNGNAGNDTQFSGIVTKASLAGRVWIGGKVEMGLICSSSPQMTVSR